MFRQMLLGSAMRLARAPENDQGAEFEDEVLDELEVDEDAEDEIEDDEQDPNDEGDDDADEPEEPPKKATRGENRVAAATRTAAEAKAETAQLRRELEEERRTRNAVPPEELQRRRNEHLATLTGDQRTDFLLNEQRQQSQAELNKIRFDNWDVNDKAAFDRLAAASPALRSLSNEVEERLALLRKDGGNIAREAVAKFLLGEKAMAKATRANNSGAKRAAAGKERQQGRSVSARGDVAPKRDRGAKGDSLEAIEARLRGVRI